MQKLLFVTGLKRVSRITLSAILCLGLLSAAPSAQANTKQEFIPIHHLDLLQVQDLAAQIAFALNLQAGVVKTYYSNIVVEGDAKLIKRVKELIAMRDKIPGHIIFEGTFITVRPNFVQQMGRKIDVNHNRTEGTRTFTLTGGSGFGIDQAFMDTVVGQFNQKGRIFDITAGWLLKEGLGKVISKPIVRVKDGETATFKSVTAVPQATASQYGTNIQYKETGITLDIKAARIVPASTPDGVPLVYAELELSDGSINQAASLPAALATDDTRMFSKGFYQNGQAFIAASLIKETDSWESKRVPGLSKIPWLGRLFRNKEKVKEQSETIVLLRPTIEEPMSQQFLAARFKNAHDLLPRDLGGRSRDSIQSHPMSDGIWQGVERVYDERCNPDTYWSMLSKYTEKEIEMLGKYFNPIRNRTGLLLSQSREQILQIIKYDKGIEQAAKEQIKAFVKETKKPAPTMLEFLIAAAHSGRLDAWAYETYKNRFNLTDHCPYR